ncbi:MAG: alpha/beta hydrolase-fold protein [Gemmatimonadota bacterium]
MIDPIKGDATRVLAEFVYRGASIQNVVLENGVNGWVYALNQLERVAGSDIWHLTVAVPADVRLGYVFRENDDLIPWYAEPQQGKRWSANRPDPLNPRVDSAQNRRSQLIGPRAEPDTLSFARSGVPAGRVEEITIDSRAVEATRSVAVYLPPRVPTTGLPILLVFDGPTYRHTVRLPLILDNLIAANRITPVVAIFVSQLNRMQELAPNEGFTRYICDELLPTVRARFGVTADPRRTIVMGSSHGGLAADWMGLSHPELFGNVISQSASLWWSPDGDPEPEFLARHVVREPRTATRFWIEVGRFEVDQSQGGGPGQVEVSRHFRDVLRAKGNEVSYSEFPGGHEYQSWRVTTPRALMHFLAPR